MWSVYTECELIVKHGLIILQALSSSENKLSHSVFTRRECFSFFFLLIFEVLCWCWYAAPQLNAPCWVSTERELWNISAWTKDIWESVGKHDIFVFMLGSVHNTERWGISFKGLWNKTHFGVWLKNGLGGLGTGIVSIHPSTPPLVALSEQTAVVQLDFPSFYECFYWCAEHKTAVYRLGFFLQLSLNVSPAFIVLSQVMKVQVASHDYHHAFLKSREPSFLYWLTLILKPSLYIFVDLLDHILLPKPPR